MDVVNTVNYALFLFVINGVVRIEGTCSTQCLIGFHNQLLKNTTPNKALFKHVFKSTHLTDKVQCHLACTNDGRCMSYNFQNEPSGDGTRLCELNSADYETDSLALKDRPGFTYYDIVPVFSSRQNDGHSHCEGQSCFINNCESTPCQNGGICQELCGQKRRIHCNCTAGFTGELCTIKAKSCLDYFKYNRSSVSGLYDIQDDGGATFTVFCDFNLNTATAWTLVMSYKLANHPTQFKGKGFNQDHPVTENTPNWLAYRLSKSRMLSIQSHSTDWRATCNYNTDGIVRIDYARSTFDNVDLMTYNAAACRKMTYVNIRGSYCQECTVWTDQDDATDFVLASYYSQYRPNPKCDFVNAPGVTYYETNFGWYKAVNSAHRCTAGQLSTTQYWFGGSIEPH